MEQQTLPGVTAERPCPQDCGHPLSEHAPSLRCRTCGRECGINCTRSILDRRG